MACSPASAASAARPPPPGWGRGLDRRLLGFQRRYQQTAVPFDWRFSRGDLDRLLRRLDRQERLINIHAA